MTMDSTSSGGICSQSSLTSESVKTMSSLVHSRQYINKFLAFPPPPRLNWIADLRQTTLTGATLVSLINWPVVLSNQYGIAESRRPWRWPWIQERRNACCHGRWTSSRQSAVLRAEAQSGLLESFHRKSTEGAKVHGSRGPYFASAPQAFVECVVTTTKPGAPKPTIFFFLHHDHQLQSRRQLLPLVDPPDDQFVRRLRLLHAASR